MEVEPLIIGQMPKMKIYENDGVISINEEGKGKDKKYNKKGELIFEGKILDNKYWDGKGKIYYDLNEDNTNNNDKDLNLEYEGEFHNGKKNGKGKQYSEDGKTIFKGIFSNDKPLEGKVITYGENGDIIGENNIKYGHANGLAWIKKNDFEFKGEYINDSFWNGKIKKFNKEGVMIINGEFKNGSFNGIIKVKNEEGELIEEEYKNGKIWTGHSKDLSEMDIPIFNFDVTYRENFEGEFMKGKRWKGKGKELYPNKMIEFEGEYDNGERIKGIEYYEDGLIKYEGEYLNGKYYKGKAYNITGEEIYEINEGKGLPKDFEKYGYRYEGEYLNGSKNGKGKEYYKEKLIYEGEYLNGKRNGRGKEYHFIDGYLIYEGEFLEGKRNGKGKEYYDNGNIKFEGEYFYSKINKKGKEYTKEGELIREGEFTNDSLWTGKKYPTKYDKSEEEYLYGERHGKVKLYLTEHIDEELLFDGEYFLGYLFKGKDYEKGKLKFEGDFISGYYDYMGKNYEKGKLIFDGEKHMDQYWTGKKYRNGSELEGEYLYGKKCGKWKEYDDEGNLEFEGEINEFISYKKGKWFNKGKIKFEGEYYDDHEWKGRKKKWKSN